MTDGYPKKVDFDPTNETGSLERARDMPVHIERLDLNGPFIAAFEDGDHVHEVVLKRHGDGFRGDCWRLDDQSGHRVGRCRGWVNHDGPCAHLWIVRSQVAAALLGSRDRAQERAENVESFDRDAEDFADNHRFDCTPDAIQGFENIPVSVPGFGWTGSAVQLETLSYGEGDGITPCLTPPLPSRERMGTRPPAWPFISSPNRRAGAGPSAHIPGDSGGAQSGG